MTWFQQLMASVNRWLRWRKGTPASVAAGVGRGYARGRLAGVVGGGGGVPVNLTVPIITGTAQVGYTLASTSGTWTNSPTGYAYQWQRSANGTSGWANISGATSASYTLVSGDQSAYVRCGVTATNIAGSSSAAYSAASAQIAAPVVQTLLSPSDISYVGYYDHADTDGLDTPFTSGITVRRVSGVPCLLMQQMDGTIIELSLSGKTPATSGSPSTCRLTSTSRRWSASWSQDQRRGAWKLFWDEPASRLWMVSAEDYPNDTEDCDTRIMTMTLVDNGQSGTVSGVKRTKLESVPDRRAFGGVAAVPAAFQSAYSVEPFAVGWGGYMSRMGARGGVALGLSAYAMPDPNGYADNATVPQGSFTVMATRDQSPRGRRLTIAENYYDATTSESVFPDGSGRPTVPPPASWNWLSPGPDGLGYWPWGDNYGGAFFVDTPARRGFVVVGTFHTGKNWYYTSQLWSDGYTIEAHIYDPVTLGAAAQGVNKIVDPAPGGMRELEETRRIIRGSSRYMSAAYDSVAQRVYVMCNGAGVTAYENRIFVYQIAG